MRSMTIGSMGSTYYLPCQNDGWRGGLQTEKLAMLASCCLYFQADALVSTRWDGGPVDMETYT
jgi:hypothetical protein